MELSKDVKKVVIYHHDDMDGFVSAKILYRYFDDEAQIEEIKCVSCNYQTFDENVILNAKPEELKNTMIIFADFRISDKILDCIPYKIGWNNFVWIDHHYTNILKMQSLYGDKLDLVPGLRIISGLCAAELCYLWTEGGSSFGSTKVAFKGKRFDTNVPEELNALLEYFPLGIKTVGDWDVWRWEKEEKKNAVYFNNFFMAHYPKPDSQEDDEYYDAFLTWEHDGAYQLALEEGKIIEQYNSTFQKGIVTKYAHKAIIRDFPEFEVIALNTNYRNSKVFDSVKDQYEIGVVWCTNGSVNSYSFYRLGKNPDKYINLANIANVFGGGGHMKAAGCVTEKDVNVIFNKDSK